MQNEIFTVSKTIISSKLGFCCSKNCFYRSKIRFSQLRSCSKMVLMHFHPWILVFFILTWLATLVWTKVFPHTLRWACYDIKIVVTLFVLSELDVAFSHAVCKHTSAVCRGIKIQGVAEIHFWCWCKHFTRNITT